MGFLDLFKRKEKQEKKEIVLTPKSNTDAEDADLTKKAIIFHTGGKRPTKELLESWIGAVYWKKENEEYPVDDNNEKMMPLATIFLKDLEYIPECLSQFELITIFMPKEIEFDNLEDSFCINTYKTLDDLVSCDYVSDQIKAFPLTEELVNDDTSIYDDGNTYYEHKIGGYPAFCQDEYDFGDDYEFVLQIASDEKAQLNIVDSGNFYFYYNKTKNKWKVYCDFY